MTINCNPCFSAYFLCFRIQAGMNFLESIDEGRFFHSCFDRKNLRMSFVSSLHSYYVREFLIGHFAFCLPVRIFFIGFLQLFLFSFLLLLCWDWNRLTISWKEWSSLCFISSFLHFAHFVGLTRIRSIFPYPFTICISFTDLLIHSMRIIIFYDTGISGLNL